jgi:hypothetical protein
MCRRYPVSMPTVNVHAPTSGKSYRLCSPADGIGAANSPWINAPGFLCTCLRPVLVDPDIAIGANR